ncbi:phosphoribosyltransferase family protein [Solibacillus isronensis]|uniref:phosphoribosyltransferase family protein n=1 Tax=Solibacillus isronensis TaxID=412383 RepID=UPI00203ABD75|nr:phosphoribosyltransferase family protein [Solibacillus isronensis]MCM3720963.1 phosphoribosyltransferase family protein [Solibacillus isronensis]
MQYNVLNAYEATVHEIDNPYHFDEHQLFDMALRINKKRSFLFVSKVLGKHLAVSPQIPILTSHLLAHRFMEVRFQEKHEFAEKICEAIKTQDNVHDTLKESWNNKIFMKQPLTIIGFAETATALGHAFFDAFSGNVRFIHTTREIIIDQQPVISFEEEHSHATSHHVYAEATFFADQTEIVLVDDEMTTGKTNVNIIRQLHETYPHLTTFTLISILDWRNAEHEQELLAFAHQYGIQIHTVSLFKGAFQIEDRGALPHTEQCIKKIAAGPVHIHSFEEEMKQHLVMQRSLSEENNTYTANYYTGSGRFSLAADEQRILYEDVELIAKKISNARSHGKCLVLGTGEFMYIPMLIAAQLGEDVAYHATTRSPIFADEQSVITNKFKFNSAEYPGVVNYLYNVPADHYEDIVIVYERILDHTALMELVGLLKPYAGTIHVVTLGGADNAEILTG